MKDRFGDPIRVGWPDFQLVWLQAALTLPRGERFEAFADIASMTGRTVAAVSSRAYALQAARLRPSEPRAVMVLGPALFGPVPAFRGPTKAQIMAGSSRCARHHS